MSQHNKYSEHEAFSQPHDDEDFLVDNIEEADLREEPEKTRDAKEYLGKLQYKVRFVWPDTLPAPL